MGGQNIIKNTILCNCCKTNKNDICDQSIHLTKSQAIEKSRLKQKQSIAKNSNNLAVPLKGTHQRKATKNTNDYDTISEDAMTDSPQYNLDSFQVFCD